MALYFQTAGGDWPDTRFAGQSRPPSERTAEVELNGAVPIDVHSQKPGAGARFLQESEKIFAGRTKTKWLQESWRFVRFSPDAKNGAAVQQHVMACRFTLYRLRFAL